MRSGLVTDAKNISAGQTPDEFTSGRCLKQSGRVKRTARALSERVARLSSAMTSSAHPDIRPVDRALEPALRARVDGKAKPPGALGRIEDLAVQLGLIRNSLAPRVERVVLLVFAGDHGLTEE